MTVDTDEARDTDQAIPAIAERIKAAGESSSRLARDPVNQPMINNWVEALRDGNPVYTSAEAAAESVHGELVAPPAMAQVWTMPGLHPDHETDDPLHAMMSALDGFGFTSVVATDCEQTYHRYLRHGERVAVTTRLESVVGPKRTGLGEGWFVTTRNVWYVGAEPVAEMMFRVLKFRPPSREAPPEPAPEPVAGPAILPAINRDTAYFWEGTAAGELRIQRCGQCGLLRHPPGPMCPECGATAPTHLVAAGHGEVYSYVVHHHPPLPGKELPLVIALVELDEGVRMLGELDDVDPDEVSVGLRVEVGFQHGDQVSMPFWRPRQRRSAR
ncbi:bifunctional MaoC family dehydratase N-terminal/OB-fold nucleic acid binding domain-containing protein [Saccharopolyspora sp. NFXS83]|uniref:bifunctional MaoC family dehydratase N-terminal/OB-fold nucleic acid binding domain-containing protein n=1 Tax=Saccharopolyspora sp. NFXS83 TaxID=2993560 RepID=UPI00224A9217|nr:bifunctional MaoC family dehydratase N-terminal/OB-fold nucleic acid binding domain-containing protein [Saccharopolyspora sp. NFXS83]MCX2730379.1 bifunctional MaoC family dehydratase N-terminal/OB-fold nucleic acid binding domain-containing protein [Saccharopolyspora sp. NFXS83]